MVKIPEPVCCEYVLAPPEPGLDRGCPQSHDIQARMRSILRWNLQMPADELPSQQGATDDHHPVEEFVQSLARGFAVMRAFAGDRSTLTIAEVARRCGLTRAGA